MELGKVYLGDCRDLLPDMVDAVRYEGLTPVVVTDPPFNIGYGYKGFKDKMDAEDYWGMLAGIVNQVPAVVIHYPEALHRLSIEVQEEPERVFSWVYNSNMFKQHRDAAFYGIKPDFRRVPQPYKDMRDKRNQARIAAGRGAKSYDWLYCDQVKNKTKGKTAHPCQMPLEVMRLIVGVLPDNIGIIDPFTGSGTTLVACKEKGIPFIGSELVEEYRDIAEGRLAEIGERLL